MGDESLITKWYDSEKNIGLIVTRPLIAHLSLYTRVKPTSDKEIGIMGLVNIFSDANCLIGTVPWFLFN